LTLSDRQSLQLTFLNSNISENNIAHISYISTYERSCILSAGVLSYSVGPLFCWPIHVVQFITTELHNKHRRSDPSHSWYYHTLSSEKKTILVGRSFQGIKTRKLQTASERSYMMPLPLNVAKAYREPKAKSAAHSCSGQSKTDALFSTAFVTIRFVTKHSRRPTKSRKRDDEIRYVNNTVSLPHVIA